MTRRPVLVPAVALLLAGVLAACSDDADDGDSPDEGPGIGTEVRGQDWRLPYEDDDVTVCGDVAVWGPLGETPTIVHADGSTTELAVDVPDDTTIEFADDEPNTRAHCLLDDAGEVRVVVSLQDRYYDLEDQPATLFAGFDADGEQRWTYDGAVGASGDFAGAGAFAVGDPDDYAWTVVDVDTGEELTVVRGGLVAPVPLSSELVADFRRLVTVEGREVGPASTVVPVDPGRALVETPDGVALVDATTGAPSWTVPGTTLPLDGAAADTSTGVAVLVADGTLYGYDLDTGEELWVSEAAVGRFGVGSVGAGVAVLPDDEFTSQVLVDTTTGDVLPEREDYVIAGDDLLLVVSEDGVPAVASVDDLSMMAG